jgi:hypothetical protein
MEVSPKTIHFQKKGPSPLIPQLELPANHLAALLLLACNYLRPRGLAQVSARDVLEATGATKSRAYELARELSERLTDLVVPVGRPPTGVAEPVAVTGRELGRQVLEYLLRHPGAAQRTSTKTHYDDGYRDFVVQLCMQHGELDVAELADAFLLPVTTLRDWLRAARTEVEPPPPPTRPASTVGSVSDLHAQTVLAQWSSWRGTFSAFCEHVRRHHGVPLGRTAIASLLELTGRRKPNRRPGRSPDEIATRDSFESFFPNAVWIGDGYEFGVELDGERFDFNLELIIDGNSAAAVGLDVRDHEDSAAVIASFEHGVHTTTSAPLALLLDNKPPNHTSAVHEALEGTLVIPATKARPQNKGHVEGAFGLFSQHAPPLRLDGDTPKQRAASLALLCMQLFFAALNMRPRAGKRGRSRIELHSEVTPTPEQIEQAKAALQARLDKQLAAQQTLRERQDPAKRAYLDAALERLGLSDPTGHVQAAIAGYALDDIANGVAIFEGKQRAQTLPEGVDVRYLLGIVRNIAKQREGMAIATALWDERMKARDAVFVALGAERDALAHIDDDARLIDLVDRALDADHEIDRYFWLTAVGELVLTHSPDQRRAAFERAARRIHTSFRVPHERRLDATRVIASKLVALA